MNAEQPLGQKDDVTECAIVFRFIKSVAMFVLGLGILGFFLFLGSETIRTAPDNAIVYVDEEAKEYFSPPLVRSDQRDFCAPVRYSLMQDEGIQPASSEVEAIVAEAPLDQDDIVYIDLKRDVFSILPVRGARVVVPLTKGEIRKQGYSPDQDHVDLGGFTDKPLGWFGLTMEKVGLRKPRWTESGEWNW